MSIDLQQLEEYFYVEGASLGSKSFPEEKKQVRFTKLIQLDYINTFKSMPLTLRMELLELSGQELYTYLKSVQKSGSESFLDDHTVYIDAYDAKNLLVWINDDEELVELDPNSYFAEAETSAKQVRAAKLPLGYLKFDAKNINKLKPERINNVDVTRINTYQPPGWRLAYPEPLPQWEGEPSTLFNRFMAHLIPNEIERERVVFWMAQALVGKNQSILALRGDRGSGKTLLSHIIWALIGTDHSIRVNPSAMKSEFNGELEGKLLALYDDNKAMVGKAGYQFRKEITNNMFTINKKHVQTTQTAENNLNIITTSNFSEDMMINYDERKLIYPDLTTKNAVTSGALTEAEAKFLYNMNLSITEGGHTANRKFLARLGYYLISLTEQPSFMVGNSNSELFGNSFWQDVVASQVYFEGLFISYCIYKMLEGEQAEYNYEELVMSFRQENENSRAGVKSWKQFAKVMEKFIYKDQHLISHIDHNEKVLTVRSDLVKVATESVDSDDTAAETYDI